MKLLSIEECTKSIATIRGSAKELQAQVHLVAVSTLVHIRDTGDSRGALALVQALPNGQRVEGLKAWFVGMSSGLISFGKNQDNGETTIKLAKDRQPAMFLIEQAETTDYGSYTKEAKPRTFSVEQLLKQLQARANDTELNTDGSAKTSPEARMVAAKLLKTWNDSVVKAMH